MLACIISGLFLKKFHIRIQEIGPLILEFHTESLLMIDSFGIDLDSAFTLSKQFTYLLAALV